MGLSRTAIAELTRISERLIAKIEAGDFAGLPSRAYATGFTRSYARAVGLDEKEIVESVRREMGLSSPAGVEAASALEPGDPARVPSARFAWWLALLAFLVVFAGGLFVWRTWWAPSVSLPSILPEETATAVPPPAPAIEPSALPSSDAAMAPDPAQTAAPAAIASPRPRSHANRRPAPSGSASPSAEAAPTAKDSTVTN